MALNEQLEQIVMTIIANAGDARVKVYEALAKAKKGEFEEAKALLKKSEEVSTEAHLAHSQLLSLYANGELQATDLLISHAQDHLMCAELARELVTEIINLHEIVQEK